MNDSELIGCTNGWKKIISEYYENASYSSEGFAAQYIDGKYYITSVGKNFSEYIDGEIISINGDTPENYVKENITGGKLKYDFKNEGIYYDGLFFYPDMTHRTPTAQKISVEIRTRNGTISETEYCSDYVRDAAASYYFEHCEGGETDNISSPLKAYCFNDEQRNVTYISLPMLTASSGEIYEILHNIKNDNVIVDLRYCPGGEISFTVNEVYPALFGRDTVIEYEAYTPFSKSNRRFSENYGIKKTCKGFFCGKKI
ncbi:MAG: S41 family peptidase [Ruminococcus sp.]|nr:S41 family peptidase [Ruminococcus sp.]